MYSALVASALVSYAYAEMSCAGVFASADVVPSYPLDTCIPSIVAGTESATQYTCDDSGDDAVVMMWSYDNVDCESSGNGTSEEASGWMCTNDGRHLQQTICANSHT